MRIPCPHCGERSAGEFVTGGPAGLRRPEGSDRLEDWIAYAHERDNPAGPHRELFYHAHGCRNWIVVARDTRSHAVLSADRPA
jgi:heterotetrameric sarcosine oxidase delta subunit